MAIPLIPLILGAASAVLGAKGIQKGLEAKKTFDEAKDIADSAGRRYRRAKRQLEEARKHTQSYLEDFGRYKLEVFDTQIRYLVEVLRKAKSSIAGFETELQVTPQEVRAFEANLEQVSSLAMGLGTAAASGALAGFGATGLVGALATASTGTAISSLAGAAATKATLAWLGGGSLAAGGLGVAGGTWVLGGIIAGPALAIGGYVLASKAEEALTEAEAYAAKVDEACAEMDKVHDILRGIERRVDELRGAIAEMVERFERVKTDDLANKERVHQMIVVGKALKELLNLAILDDQGGPDEQLTFKISGIKEAVGPDYAD